MRTLVPKLKPQAPGLVLEREALGAATLHSGCCILQSTLSINPPSTLLLRAGTGHPMSDIEARPPVHSKDKPSASSSRLQGSGDADNCYDETADEKRLPLRFAAVARVTVLADSTPTLHGGRPGPPRPPQSPIDDCIGPAGRRRRFGIASVADAYRTTSILVRRRSIAIAVVRYSPRRSTARHGTWDMGHHTITDRTSAVRLPLYYKLQFEVLRLTRRGTSLGSQLPVCSAPQPNQTQTTTMPIQVRLPTVAPRARRDPVCVIYRGAANRGQPGRAQTADDSGVPGGGSSQRGCVVLSHFRRSKDFGLSASGRDGPGRAGRHQPVTWSGDKAGRMMTGPPSCA
ncbi:hypothetical protein C8Q74DRAFT_92703 [Fomes fomentarius]|nr:hypothetical protein C8Q74DRAFT_92703 [Fomes fomentarius]